MASDDTIEKLIAEVEKNQLLYDLREPDYKDPKKKGDVWKEIAQRVGFPSGEAAAKKWTNLKDSYVGYIRKLKTRSGQGLSGRITKYKWADQLRFLNDYTAPRRSNSNLDAASLLRRIEDGEVSDDQSEADTLLDISGSELTMVVGEAPQTQPEDTADEREVPPPTVSHVVSLPRKRKNTDSDVNNKIVEYLNSKKCKEGSRDGLSLFFQSSLATVRTFPPARQLEAKRKISRVVLDIEEELMNEL